MFVCYNASMSEDIKKNILIVGCEASVYPIAKKLSVQNEIFVAPGYAAMNDFAKTVDIREDNVKEMLDFVLENAIDLTIVISEKAIKSNITAMFQNNGQLIFAPLANSADSIISKANCKKFLYKLHLPTTRFGVFEKQQPALDYLKEANFPLVIRAEENFSVNNRLVCTTTSVAKTFIDDLFSRGEKRILIEDYVYGHEFSFYVITDGYSVLPLTSAANYKFTQDGDGGMLTSGVGCYAPDYKISNIVEDKLMRAASSILNSLERRGVPYLGILGFDCVLTGEDKFVIIELKTFFGEHDCQTLLNLLDEDILNLFEACANASFADDYKYIRLKDLCSVSCTLHSGKFKNRLVSGLDMVDECDITPINLKINDIGYITGGGREVVITKTAKTLSRAAASLYEEIECIKFEGKKYRKDILLK